MITVKLYIIGVEVNCLSLEFGVSIQFAVHNTKEATSLNERMSKCKNADKKMMTLR